MRSPGPVRRAYDARAQHRPLLAPEEGEPHAEPARRIGDEPGAKGAQDAHGRRVVVGPRTARDGIVVGREHERPGSGPEIHEEVDPRALDGPIRIAADRQAGRAQHGLGQLGPLPVGPPGEEGRQVARRGRGQPAIAGEVEQGRRGPAPAAVHQPRGRDVQGAAHGAAQPQPPAARAFRGHAGERRRAGPERRKGQQPRGVLARRRGHRPDRHTPELRHARGRDRQVRRLVALTPPGLGREVRAIRLDHETVERQRPHHLGEPARARVGHRARDRDQEPEAEAAPRHLEVSREAVEDPADGRDPLGLADVEEIRVRLSAMEQDGLPDGPRQPELGDERGPLDGPRREVAVVVEPDLADRDDPRRAPRARQAARGSPDSPRWHRAGGCRRPRGCRAPPRRGRPPPPTSPRPSRS